MIRRLLNALYNKLIAGFELWQQLLNIAVVIAIAGSLTSVIISLILGNSLASILAFLAGAVFAIICLYMSMRMKDVVYAVVLFSVVANFILFPVMYFSSGGYHGGMPLWLLFSLVISWVIIPNRKILFIVYGLSIVFQSACILYSEAHPETVTLFSSEQTVALDVVQSLVLVSFVFGFIIKFQNGAYEKKKQELDRANALLAASNERITLHSMYTLAKTIDAKDGYTNGHSLRVAQYSRMIAQRLQFSGAELDNLYNMAMLHDIGKIGIPDSIINKPSTLTFDEYNIIKQHPVIGYEILSEMPEIESIGIGARWHHERYDGGGYPDGLKGDEIPLVARIICVADAYDAMTSDRSYRSSMSTEDVIREFENGSGSQFDPLVTGIMLDIIREVPFEEQTDDIPGIEDLYKYAIKCGISNDMLLSADNMDRYIDTAVDAFRDYALFRHVFKGDYDPEVFKRMVSVDFRSRAEIMGGIAAGEDYESVMIFEPPGSRKTGMIDYFGAAHAEDYTLLLRPVMYRLESFEKYAAEKRSRYLDDKTWYLYLFVTREDYKGKGYGKKLLNIILSFADERGYRICLETNDRDNVGLYEHFGFETVDRSMYQDTLEHYNMIYTSERYRKPTVYVQRPET